MLQTKINNKTFSIDFKDGSPVVDGEPLSWDLKKIDDAKFHIIHQNKSYSAEVVALDKTSKTITLKINGRIYKVEVKDRYDLLLEKMGMSGAASGKAMNIKAPMPGLIVQVNVQPNTSVKTGDALLVLEAMKMENVLKASTDATVKSVKIKKGDSVEKGQVLIEF